RRLKTDDIVALLGHGVPPKFLHVAFEFSAQRTVIPKAIDAAVDFRGLKNEPTALAQRDNFLHAIIGSGFRHTRRPVFVKGLAMSRRARQTNAGSAVQCIGARRKDLACSRTSSCKRSTDTLHPLLPRRNSGWRLQQSLAVQPFVIIGAMTVVRARKLNL